MPLATVHLIALSAGQSINKFLRALSTTTFKPLIVSRVVRWIITPEQLSVDPLLSTKWDLLVIALSDAQLPSAYTGRDWIDHHWSITAGVPSSLLKDFESKNDRLLHPRSDDVPALTGSLDKPQMTSSAQGLELNTELLDWSKTFELGQDGAVSMFNLLAFHPGEEAHKNYLEYGKAFATSIGSRRGGNAKIVGKVVASQKSDDEDSAGWDEIALAHYPSIRHFTDMLASQDYQEVNHKHRLRALRDTCILCTTELDPNLTISKARL